MQYKAIHWAQLDTVKPLLGRFTSVENTRVRLNAMGRRVEDRFLRPCGSDLFNCFSI